jgi:hypothetical protein
MLPYHSDRKPVPRRLPAGSLLDKLTRSAWLLAYGGSICSPNQDDWLFEHTGAARILRFQAAIVTHHNNLRHEGPLSNIEVPRAVALALIRMADTKIVPSLRMPARQP